jgi:hypothetical protein
MTATGPHDLAHPSPAPHGDAHVCSTTVPGLRLCPACLTRARTSLRALPTLYEDCVHAMNPAPRGHIVERVSGTRAPHSLNETAVEARTKIQAALASWAGLVVGERSLTARGGDVDRLARFLAVHLDWLAARPGAADFVAEVDELVSGALRAIDAGPAGRIELGPCIEPGCDGRLLAEAPGHGAGPPEVGCDTGRHAWRPDQWLLLRRRLDRAGRT